MEKHAEVGAPPEAAPLEGSTVEGARWGSMPRFPAKSSTASFWHAQVQVVWVLLCGVSTEAKFLHI